MNCQALPKFLGRLPNNVNRLSRITKVFRRITQDCQWIVEDYQIFSPDDQQLPKYLGGLAENKIWLKVNQELTFIQVDAGGGHKFNMGHIVKSLKIFSCPKAKCTMAQK